METIPVEPGPDRNPSFATPAEAIAYRSAAQGRAAADSDAIRGRVLRELVWSDRRAHFRFADGTMLEIWSDGYAVDWSIGPGRAEGPLGAASIPDPCVLAWTDGPFVWDRGELAAQRTGGRIAKLFATDADLYVYFEKLPIISFHRVLRSDNGESFLFWCETD